MKEASGEQFYDDTVENGAAALETVNDAADIEGEQLIPSTVEISGIGSVETDFDDFSSEEMDAAVGLMELSRDNLDTLNDQSVPAAVKNVVRSNMLADNFFAVSPEEESASADAQDEGLLGRLAKNRVIRAIVMAAGLGVAGAAYAGNVEAGNRHHGSSVSHSVKRVQSDLIKGVGAVVTAAAIAKVAKALDVPVHGGVMVGVPQPMPHQMIEMHGTEPHEAMPIVMGAHPQLVEQARVFYMQNLAQLKYWQSMQNQGFGQYPISSTDHYKRSKQVSREYMRQLEMLKARAVAMQQGIR